MEIADLRKFILFGKKINLSNLKETAFTSKSKETVFLHVVDLLSGLRQEQNEQKNRALCVIKNLAFKPDYIGAEFYKHALNKSTDLDPHEIFNNNPEIPSQKNFFWDFYFRTNSNILPHPDQIKPINMFQYWDKEPPKDVDSSMKEWKLLFGETNYQLYNEESARDVIRKSFGKEGVTAYDNCWHPAMKSDLFRAIELAERGGVYIDSDMKPVDGALDYLRRCNKEVHFWLRTDQPNGAIFNGVLFARPKSQIMALYAEYCIVEIHRNSRGHPVNTTGPGVLRKAMKKLYGSSMEIDATSSGRFEMINNFAKTYAPSYRGDSRSWQKAMAQRENTA